MEPERAYSDSFRLTSSGKPTKLPSGFTPLRNQHISDQESLFLIPGSIQERDRIMGQEKYFFQPESERVIPYDPENVVSGERSTKKQQIFLNTSDEARSLNIRDYISTKSKHNVFIPESTIINSKLWMKMAQFSEQTLKDLERLHENN
ncbi:hypothetical protein O181_043338 [Austropuccinia psidii MF-1]|uniref:Uncharacterized protein n=1 Tax=Austropuccinia psidii MF-1 TaxID=1389203 RepID=A0A9Q3DMX1_9BASI|nr:hypothetical protein [Austropuccinia psidii MF-1]